MPGHRQFQHPHHRGHAANRFGENRPDKPRHEKTITGVRRPYNCTYKVAGVVGIAGSTDQPNASNPYPVYWPVGGMVREMYGSVLSSDETKIASNSPAAFGMIGVEITIADGRADIFKEAAAAGSAGAGFAPYSDLFSVNGSRVFLLERPIYASLAWQVTFCNFSTDDTVTLTPSLSFFVDEDQNGVHRAGYGRIEVPFGMVVEVVGGPAGRSTIHTADER